MLALCQELRVTHQDDLAGQLSLGVLLSNYGFLADARICHEQAQALAPNDLRATINLANLARDVGKHAEARRLYAQLLQVLPDHPVIRRNALTSLEYDPEVPDAERLAQARALGEQAAAALRDAGAAAYLRAVGSA